jgi:phage terminase large subunit GpA-like protein
MNLATQPTTKFITFRPAEQKAFRRRKRLPGPQWAERNIYVPVGSRQGLYRNHNNPPLHGILEAASRPHVRTVVMAKGIQTGGTLVFYALLLREADYSGGGDNALIVMADERSVKKLSKKRLQPMIDKSPTLAAIKSGNPDDTTIYSITLADGFTIDIGWASSEMSVSSESYRVVILDEISKYKATGNIQDAKGRATVYPDSKKIFIFSSPGVDSDDPAARDPLMKEAEACDVIMEYHVQCPDCGADQVMTDEQIKYPMQQALLPGSEAADAKTIRRLKLAYYECPHCLSRWNDFKRDKAVLKAMKHGWQPIDKSIEHPQSLYFHYPSWLSPFMSLSEVAARRIEAQGDDEKLRKYENLVAGRTYRHEKKERPHASILSLRDDRPEGLVPSVPIAAISIFADMQKRGFWYKVTAWGFGLEQESWTLKAGFVDSWEALRKMMFESVFEDVQKNPYYITLRALDSGGGEGEEHADLSRTAEAYLFAAANPGVLLFKGRRQLTRNYSNPTDIDRIPGTNKPLQGSAKLYTINTTFYKDKLAGKLLVNPSDPGAWHLHKDIDEDFAKQMCVEYKNPQGHWECPKNKANHYWDCASNELALVEIAQVKFWQRPEGAEQAAPQRKIYSKGVIHD